jgi:hypothetical protein
MSGMWVIKMVFVAFICCIAGIVAYVDYRPGGENLSVAIRVYMSSLGATVRDKFTNDVSCEYCSFFFFLVFTVSYELGWQKSYKNIIIFCLSCV